MNIFMLLIYLLIVKASYKYQNNYYLYPTDEETIELSMDKLFNNNTNLIYYCQGCVNHNVTVTNTINIKGKSKGQKFQSVSFYNNQFVALTQNSQLNFYSKMENGSVEFIDSININSDYKCFSVTQTTQNQVFLDCYLNDQFYLFTLQENQLVQVYANESSTPIQTKLISYNNKTFVYILHQECFKHSKRQYCKLTVLFQQSNTPFIFLNKFNHSENFFVSQIQQTYATLFVQFQNQIKSYILSPLGIIQNGSVINIKLRILNCAHYYSIYQYYQFDRILLTVTDEIYTYFYRIMFNQQFYIQSFDSKNLGLQISEKSQLYINDQFIIIQNNHTLSIFQNKPFDQIILFQTNVLRNDTILYFDQIYSELYIFNKDILSIALQIPVLRYVSSFKNSSFIILAKNLQSFSNRIFQVNIYAQQVSSEDINIYLIQEIPQIIFYNLLQFPFYYYIINFSGPLIKAISNVSNSSLGSFNDCTFTKFNYSFNKNYSIVTLFTENQFLKYQLNTSGYIFIVALSNQTLDFYLDKNAFLQLEFDITYISDVSNPIQITYFVENQQFLYLICISLNQDAFQLYTLNYNNNQLIVYNNLTLDTDIYKDFQLLSDSVVLILQSNQIVIYKFDKTFEMLVNAKILKDLSNEDIIFNPINIIINQQYQSRVLFINNKHNFIIGLITTQFDFVLLSIQKVNFLIKYLSLVNDRLILSYICENTRTMCFQVWNIKNITHPIYQNKMRPAEFIHLQDINFYSDNLFFYLKVDNFIRVYNPQLPTHSSLFYQFLIDSKYFSCIAKGNFAILSFNYSLYSLQTVLLQSFFNNSIHYDFISQQIFNFTLYSELNQTNKIQTQNNSIMVINNYQQIILNNISLQINQSNTFIELNSNDLIVQGEVLYFDILYKNNYTNLTNYIEYFNITSCPIDSTLISQYDNQFILISNQNISIYNTNITHYFGYYIACIASTNDLNIIYILCKNVSARYQIVKIEFSKLKLNSSVILNLMETSFTNDTWISVQNKHLYIWNQNQTIMYFLGRRDTSILNNRNLICYCTQFGFLSILLLDHNDKQTIVYFYIKPSIMNKDKLFYKFVQYNLNKYEINLGDENYLLLKTPTEQFLTFTSIMMIKQKNKEIVLMLSNPNFNCLFSFLWIINQNEIQQSKIIYQDFLQTSPPFQKKEFYISQRAQTQNNLLLFLYTNSHYYMLTFYNISNQKNIQFQNALLYKGGYVFNLSSVQINAFSFMASNNQEGKILILYTNGSILELNLNKFCLNITYTTDQKKKVEDIYLIAFNSEMNSFSQIILQEYHPHSVDRSSFYILLTIILIVLVTFYFIWNEYQKKIEIQYNEIDLGMEL